MRWILCIALLATLGACSRAEVALEGRPCDDGNCVAGYDCHPEKNLCVAAVLISCENEIDGVCPETTNTGDACSQPGSFIPCALDFAGCEGGCRTCTEQGTWGECTSSQCRLGETESCRTCDHDCNDDVQNALAVCTQTDGQFSCSYAGACSNGTADADGVLSNGCECTLSEGGIEICDGVDNDCDGVVDNDSGGVDFCADAQLPVCRDATCVCSSQSATAQDSCGTDSFCNDTSGSCQSCEDRSIGACGADCGSCPGTFRECAGGACWCRDSRCAARGACASSVVSCQACSDSDADYCGSGCQRCSGEAPICDAGACVCDAGTGLSDDSCSDGKFCPAASICQDCSIDTACGPDCQACAGATPACAAGGDRCVCIPGSCPDGFYCGGAGTCLACTCPDVFGACQDTGGSFVCRCDDTSCGGIGTCSADGKTCTWFDDFNDASDMLSGGCGETGLSNSSWERRPQTSVGATPELRSCLPTPIGDGSTERCWVTDRSNDYNNCENSCIGAPPLNLDLLGLSASATLTVNILSDLQDGRDGATLEFVSDSGPVVITPAQAWDTAEVFIDTSVAFGFCGWYGTWPTTGWPGWGNYGSCQVPNGCSDAWRQFDFSFSTATHPELFYSNFWWRIWMRSDANGTAPGIAVDNVQFTLTLDE